MESLQVYLIAFALIGALAVLLFIWLQLRIRSHERSLEAQDAELLTFKERLPHKEAQVIHLEQENERLRVKLDQQNTLLINLSAQKAESESKLAAKDEFYAEKIKVFETLEQRLKESFAAISSQTIHANHKNLIDMAQETFGRLHEGTLLSLEKRDHHFSELIKPIKDSLSSVDHRILELEKQRIGAYEGLFQQVQSLIESQQSLRSETSKLVNALHSPVTRGRWGELQLKRVVEMAGMIEYCDFFQQQSKDTEEGKKRPDLIVRLPGQKNIVVDAKAPLSAYLSAVEEDDELKKGMFLSEHAAAVKKHIQQLSLKAYWDQFQPTPEFVVMFLPGETFFSAALAKDPTLIEFGVDQKVILATPTTLIALLRSVSYGWRHEHLTENARDICDLGKTLYNRIADLSSHFSDLGQKLQGAVATYNRTVGTLESRVLATARKFHHLQVNEQTKSLRSLEHIESLPRDFKAQELTEQPIESSPPKDFS